MDRYQIKYYAVIGCYKDPNKIYIGQTIRNIKQRFSEHKLKNYSDAFVIDESYSTDPESLDIENGWMDYYTALGWTVISKKQNNIVRTLSEYAIQQLSDNWKVNNPMFDPVVREKVRLHNVGKVYTDDTIKKMSRPRTKKDSFIAAWKDPVVRGRRRDAVAAVHAVLQLNLQGNIITEFSSAAEAGKSLGKKGGGDINAVCLGKQKTAYGYRWIKKKDYNDKCTTNIL